MVYSCNLNFHTVVPYLDLLTINGLVERVEGEKLRFRTTLKGAQALHHFQEIEKLMPEMEVQEEPA
ncbi:MAG: DNA-binding protein [Methanothrix sp.]|nr:DNA-binding protein [Methanothrix sp.]